MNRYLQAAITTLALREENWEWEDGIYLMNSANLVSDATIIENADQLTEIATELVDEYLTAIEEDVGDMVQETKAQTPLKLVRPEAESNVVPFKKPDGN